MIDPALIFESGINLWVRLPGPGDIAEVPSFGRRWAIESGRFLERLDSHLVEALTLFSSRFSEGKVEFAGDITQCVLHRAYIVGIRCLQCQSRGGAPGSSAHEKPGRAVARWPPG